MSVEGHLIEFSSASAKLNKAAKAAIKGTKKTTASVQTPHEKENAKEGTK